MIIMLRIGHLSTIYHTALLMQGQKTLESLGIDVEWKLYGGGPAIVEAMRKNEIDIGYIGLPPAMTGIAQGVPIKCVAGGHIEGTALATREKPAQSTMKALMKHLEGKRIGSPPKGSIHDILIRHLLKKHKTKAEVINYPWADFIPLAMEQEEIDASIGTPALITALKKDLNAHIALKPRRIWPYNPSYGILARTEHLQNPDLQRFIQAHEDSSNKLIKEPHRAARIIADTLGHIDHGFALEVIKQSPRYCASLPAEYIASTMRFVPVMMDLGYLDRSMTSQEVFHTRIIDQLHPPGHHYNTPLNL